MTDKFFLFLFQMQLFLSLTIGDSYCPWPVFDSYKIYSNFYTFKSFKFLTSNLLTVPISGIVSNADFLIKVLRLAE